MGMGSLSTPLQAHQGIALPGAAPGMAGAVPTGASAAFQGMVAPAALGGSGATLGLQGLATPVPLAPHQAPPALGSVGTTPGVQGMPAVPAQPTVLGPTQGTGAPAPGTALAPALGAAPGGSVPTPATAAATPVAALVASPNVAGNQTAPSAAAPTPVVAPGTLRQAQGSGRGGHAGPVPLLQGIRRVVDEMGSSVATEAAVKETFADQVNVINGNVGTAEWKAELRDTFTLVVFAFMAPGSPHIKLIHTFFRCTSGDDMPAQVRGKSIAFLGDSTDSSTPNPVIPPEQNMWAVKKIKISTSEQDFATYFGEETHVGTFWKPDDQGLTEEQVPYALRLPPTHAAWLAEEPRTLFEYYLFIASKLAGDNPWDRGGLELPLGWTVAASQQSTTNAANSCLALTMVGISERTPAFDKKCWARLALAQVTMSDGRPHPSERGTGASRGVVAPDSQGATPPTSFYAGLAALHQAQAEQATRQTAILQQIATSQPAAANYSAAVAGATPKGRIYGIRDQTAIMAWSSVPNVKMISPIYALWSTTGRVEDQKLELANGMAIWAKQNHEQISEPEFTAEAMKAMIELRPNPGSYEVDVLTGHLGETPLLCLPPGKREKILNALIEKAMLLSGQNASFSDHLRLLSSGGKLGKLPMPPTNYAALLRLIATYAAKLFACWTEHCSHYKQVVELWNILKSPRVVDAADEISADMCGKIVYAVCRDSRHFFHDRMHPNAIANGTAVYPVSMLSHINVYVAMNTPIPTDHNYPRSWAAAAAVYDAARTAMTPGGLFNQLDQRAFPLGAAGGTGELQDQFSGAMGGWGGPLPRAPPAPASVPPPAPANLPLPPWPGPAWGTHMVPPVASSGQPQAPHVPSLVPPGGGGASKPPPTVDKAKNKWAHVHPEFKKLMIPVLKKHNNRVSLTEALSKVGKTIPDLPQLQGFQDNQGKSIICWNHLLGICSFVKRKGKCQFAKGHLAKEQLSQDFVKLALDILSPAMAAMLQEPAKQKTKPSS